MVKKLFILGVIFIPFSDFWTLLPLGELQHELSAYFFLPLMALMFADHLRARKMTTYMKSQQDPTDLLIMKMMWLMLAIICLSCITNLPDMVGGSFRGRYPINKFITSTLVVMYGFGLAYVSYGLGREYSWHELVVWPMAISVIICVIVGSLEMLAWTSSVAASIYYPFAKLVHGGFSDIYGISMSEITVMGRARSVSFEPPSLANFAGFALPWMYAGIYSAPRRRQWAYLVLLTLCVLLIIAAWSRTSAVLLFGNIVVLFLLRFIYLPPRPAAPHVHRAVSFLIIVSLLSILLAICLGSDSIVAKVIGGDSVSNITRLASITAAVNMFLDHPFWGYGFGQYGFHFVQYMPGWANYSWEFRAWVNQDPIANVWPPVYSVYARFGAELGFMGILIWIGIWFWLAKAIWRATLAYQQATGNILLMSYPLIMGCYCALLSGIALDSLRTPVMWINMGLGCCFLRHVRSRLPELKQGKTTAP